LQALAKYPEITVKAGVRDPEKSKDLALGASTVSVVAQILLTLRRSGGT